MLTKEYDRLFIERMHAEQRWENQPASYFTLSDLDTAEIQNTVVEAVRLGRLNEPGSREPEEMLRCLGLMRDGVPLRAAAVLFGKTEAIEPLMAQCLLRVARFRGLEKSRILDNRQFIGNAFTLLSGGQQFLYETQPIASRFESGRMQRIDEPLYPPLAISEALANALCHRDYSLGGGSIGLAIYDDRLEVTSIGRLHFGLTPDNLFESHDSMPWNPLIARTFYRCGIIEERGRGTLRMVELATEAGLPIPEIEEQGECLTVRFRHSSYPTTRLIGEELTQQQNAIHTILRRSKSEVALREICPMLGRQASERRVRQDLAALKALGLARTAGHGRGAYWKSA